MMLLTDYFYSDRDATWDFALASGVRHGVIRLPERDFDPGDFSQMRAVYDRFTAAGLRPVVVEPMPNALHDPIKAGLPGRDKAIEKVIAMMANMDKLDLRAICFNFMAHVGWTRTTDKIPVRGGACVTGFRLADFNAETAPVTHEEMWKNYEYFLKAVLPYAEKYGVRLALHPDDPPLEKLGNTARILTSADAFRKAMALVPSDWLGITFCQANFVLMGEDLYRLIPEWKEKIFFVHFRNVMGQKTDFHETFHDEGAIEMGRVLRCYVENGVDVPIRVDHVPTYPTGDSQQVAGYGAIGRLFAIGYLKGLLEGIEK
ncbi:MAG: mannonate dehydratase [Clostridia bacterium]|nr:mannonate dehydratase [Clostridia bacterium]